MPYAVLLFLAGLVGALAQNRTTFLSTKCGIMLRAALTSAIYEDALCLSPSDYAEISSGEVTNLVAVDTQKLFDVMIEIHNIWSCPMLIIAVAAMLAIIIGPELVVGVALLILSVPMVKVFVQRMLKIRKERSKYTDSRINLLTSMLQGIRVTKLNHYESKVEERVHTIRQEEINLLKRELFMWGVILTTAVATPLIAVMAAYSFYALVDEGNILTPANTFSALLLFSILRFPINMTARLIGKLAQATDAIARVSAFLEREKNLDLSSKQPLLESTRGTLIDLREESFAPLKASAQTFSSLGTLDDSTQPSTLSPTLEETSFKLGTLSFTVRRGEVLAVVGRVGSGKSTLLRALLGEIATTGGGPISLHGTTAYASQEAFILNTSLRENVLFGGTFDLERYNSAIQACCLQQDIQRLDPAGDLTQIGERGVTLSGGQKQRVALARAVFSRSDVVLLDDCFSALDATTASAVFDSLFGHDGTPGALKDCATVLATHSLQFLPRVDRLLVMTDGSPSFYGTWAELQALEQENADDVLELIQQSSHGDDNERSNSSTRKLKKSKNLTEDDGIIMTVEEREYGVSSLKVWARWFDNAGGWVYIITQTVFLVFDRGLYVASDW